MPSRSGKRSGVSVDRGFASSEFLIFSPHPQPPPGVSSHLSVVSSPPPVRYTPPHLAERIRAAVIIDGERKTITALFADLKGSTALIEGLDPEEARAIIDPALQLMMDAVHRYEGYVAQALGDGIFALFGRRLPMRITRSERYTLRCVCKKRCVAIAIR